ncbi:MAG: AMP-binding protein, partial [Treponema sp.]|nr:AMP-binding protein [Treponema sp.]
MIDLERLTLGALSQKAAAHFRNRLAFALYRDGHTFRRITYGEWGLRTRQFGGMLRTLGLKTGDRVLILAENCPEWPIVYFGAALGGFVSVPVLLAFSPEQIKTIGDHAGVAALCVTEKTCSKIAQAGIDPAIPRVYMDTLTEPDRVPGIRVSIQGREKRIPLGPGEGDWFPEIQEDDLASLWYTSGTTGASKGVMLSHRNLVFTAKASGSLMRIFPRDRLLSVLPLAHTYECTLGLVAALMSGASITYLDRPPAPAALLEAMQSLRPTAMVTVPIFIEKLYQSRIAPALKANPLYRFPLTRFLAIKIAGYKLMGAFGSSIRFFGIGGTALSPEVETFLRKAQFPYAPGYGLTETSPLVAGTAPYQFSAGSVGRLLTGVEVRISDAAGEDEGHPAGEIQVRGPNIMQGYYRDP